MKQAITALRSLPKQRPILFTLITIYLLYLLIAGVALPHYLKKNLPEWLAPFPELNASIEDVHFNPFLLRLTLDRLTIDEATTEGNRKLAGLNQASANLQLSSIFHQALVLSELSITKPYGRLTKATEGQFLWEQWQSSDGSSEQLSNPAASADTQASSNQTDDQAPFPLVIEHFAVHQATLDFEDQSRKTPYIKQAGPIDLELKHFSTLPQDEGNYQLNIALPQGDEVAEFKWQGRIGLTPIFSEGSLELNQLALRTLWEYIQDDVNYETKSGSLSVQFDYQLTVNDDVELTLKNGKAQLEHAVFSAKGEEQPLIQLERQEVSGLFFDLQNKQVTIAETNTLGLNVLFDRLTNGDLKLIKVLAERPIEEALSDAATEATDHQTEPWQLIVDKIRWDNASMQINDQTTQPAAQLTMANLSGQISHLNLMNEPSQVSLSLDLLSPERPDDIANLTAKGDFLLTEQQAAIQLDLTNLSLETLQPYLNADTELALESLLFELNGLVEVKNSQVTFDGSSQLRDIKLVNKAQSQAILAGKGLYFEGIQFSQSKKSLNIDTILLDQMRYPVNVLKREQDGTITNFSQLSKVPSTSSTETPPVTPELASNTSSVPPEEDWYVTIGKIAIENNTLQFSDRALDKPVYFNIEQLNGVIDKLSSKELSKADASLAGQINGYAPFKVKGQINPLSEDAYTDIEVTMSGIALSTFSPYTSHFLNYPLKQGKLSTEVNYRLNHSELQAKNHLLIDQLELGEYVESEAGLGLPLPLAVSLLKSNAGEIEIDLPIEGNIDDPDFKYSNVVLNTLINIVTKAATSPFKLIANLANSDQDLSQLQFKAGYAQATEATKEKATQLVSALRQRQALKLSIQGQTDQNDVLALQKDHWARQISAQGLRGDYRNPIYRDYLATLAKQPAPATDADTQALEQQLLVKLTIHPETLAGIAQQRATLTRKMMLDAGLDEKRIFIQESALNQTNENDNAEATGVVLEIK